MSSDPYQAYPSFPTGAPFQFVEEPAVQLVAKGPAKQRRLTVAFRLILVIPHAFVLVFLNLAGFVVAFLGWWGALFMGRLPRFAVTYLSGLARWNARYYGYLFLLTDAYPPFTFEDDLAYPVVIDIPPAGSLNRFAVFFRFILAIWGNIVQSVVTYGAATIVAFVAWLITLITGKLPAPLHLAFTAVLRYQTRYYCYLGMLTPTYPWKLFGDEPVIGAPVTAAAAETAQPADTAAPTETMPPAQSAETAPPVEGAWGTPPADWTSPAYGSTPGYGTAPGYDTASGYGTAPADYGTPGEWGSGQPAAAPASWRLILPRSAKNLLILFIILGVITDVGSQVLRANLTDRTANAANVKAAAVSQWDNAFNTLNSQLTKDSTASCGQTLSCYTKADGQAAASLASFANQVQAITMPSAVAAEATTVVADARKASHDFTVISAATSPALYQSTYSGTGVTKDLQTLSTDVQTFATDLDNS